jgi:hypothetical protein
LGPSSGMKARLFVFVVAVGVAMWLAHQPTEAGEVTCGILEWLGNAVGAFVTLLRTLFA